MDRMAEVGPAEVEAYRVVEEVAVEEDRGARAVRGRNSDDRTTYLRWSPTGDRAGVDYLADVSKYDFTASKVAYLRTDIGASS